MENYKHLDMVEAGRLLNVRESLKKELKRYLDREDSMIFCAYGILREDIFESDGKCVWNSSNRDRIVDVWLLYCWKKQSAPELAFIEDLKKCDMMNKYFSMYLETGFPNTYLSYDWYYSTGEKIDLVSY